ncbi:MAG TPA: class I SAM-dependent methyltransferase [Devosia sp.]|nr:class I SAM-dependent methyltransferase [Devosia sp.]
MRKGHALDLEYGHFLRLIPDGAKCIDIGSGVGYLATYLTEHGRPCVATEITPERGLREDTVLTWHETDGIHLGNFEPHGTYDAVVSTQVIEHFHPDDVEEHFRGACALLRPGGKYVFNTPHAFLGPQDLSRVFLLDRPRFMHLKEYTHRDLGEIASRAGFSNVTAVYIPPSSIRRRLPLVLNSHLLYLYLTGMERLLAGVRLPPLLLRAMLFSGDVFMTATK